VHVTTGLAGTGEGDGLAPSSINLLDEQVADLGVGAVLADPLLDDAGEFSGEVAEGLVEDRGEFVDDRVEAVEPDGDEAADFFSCLLAAEFVGNGEIPGEDLDGPPLRAF